MGAFKKFYVGIDLLGNYLTGGKQKTAEITDPEHIVNKEYVDALAGEGSTITEDIVVSTQSLALPAGGKISKDMTVTEAFKKLLEQILTPTLNAPTFALAYSGVAAAVETGTIANVTLTATLNRGTIMGKLVGTIWQTGTMQDYRSGAATQYTVDGTISPTNNTKTLTNYSVTDGANTFAASVNYGVGPQPLNSKGENFSTPLIAGTLAANATFQGQRNAFYGTSASVVAPSTTSAQVRALTGKTLNPANGTTISVTIPAGAKKVEFVYPANLRALTSCKYVELSNTEIKGVFSETLVSVEGANGASAIINRVYHYAPAEPYQNTVTYTFTI